MSRSSTSKSSTTRNDKKSTNSSTSSSTNSSTSSSTSSSASTSAKYHQHHHLECCDWTSGVDNLMKQYKKDQKYIMDLVLNNPQKLIDVIWKPEGPLAIDENCGCKMGAGDIRSAFSCSQCKNLRRIVDFRDGAVDTEFTIKCGKKKGQTMIVRKMAAPMPFLEWDDEAKSRTSIYLRQYQQLSTCGSISYNPDFKCMSGDSFTTQILINWTLGKIFSDLGMKHIEPLHTAFICNKEGYLLRNINNSTNIPKKYISNDIINPTISKSIFLQLLVMFKELSKYYFSHGIPSLNSLKFVNEPHDYVYEGTHVTGPITLQLTNFTNSSATFNNVHLFPRSVHSTMYLQRVMFPPDIINRTVRMSYCDEVYTCLENASNTCDSNLNNFEDICSPTSVNMYRLTNSTINIYLSMRHIGFPLYSGSFDFYCFMISLMLNPQYYNSIMADKSLYRLWAMMWTTDDLIIVEQRIKQTFLPESIDYLKNSNYLDENNLVIDIIRGLWLRCDILNFMWILIGQDW